MDSENNRISTSGAFKFEGIAYELIKKKQAEYYDEKGRVVSVQVVLNELLRELHSLKKTD